MDIPAVGLDLEEVVAELQRRKETSRDVVVNSENIWVSNIAPNIQLGFQNNGSRDYYPLTDWAHSQLADKCGIPQKYYQRMLASDKGQLLADNVMAWVKEKERRLIRIQDGKIRAILSDRYRPLDDFDFLCCALEEFKAHTEEVNITRCDLSEKHMYVKATLPYSEQEIRENDKVVPGVILSNSEVGAGSFRIEPFMIRLVCTNGMIGEHIIRQVHLGERREAGDFWSDETREKKDDVFWSEIKDVIRATLRLETFQGWFEAFRQASFERIESPGTALETVGLKLKMSAEKRSSLINYFIEQNDGTQWGLGNVIARMAQDEETPEEQIELERIASTISVMPGPEFQRYIFPASGVHQIPLTVA